MKHFAYYPKIEYGNEIAINITVRAKIRDAVLNKNSLCYDYLIKDTDTPESIAFKYYGNTNLVWGIYYANDIFHPTFDWALSYNNFLKYIQKKYGSVQLAMNVNNIHHYEYYDAEHKKHFIIDETTYKNYLNDDNKKDNAKIVTPFEYEFKLNERKKFIKILDKSQLLTLVNDLKNIFK
jgi:hypothetical protein